MTRKTSGEIRLERKHYPHVCNGGIQLAPLWPRTGENLGTLTRTADAVGACMVVPLEGNAAQAMRRGNTIGIDKVCTHWIHDPILWLADQNTRIIGVELAHDAKPLAELLPANHRAVVVLGHENGGIPDEAWPYLTEVVEIPMFGVGNSLNVAVAGSLVAYKLAKMV